jgi:23S rRNA (uracil1939-C5)-methyltransferase
MTFEGLAYPGKAFGRDEHGRMIFAPFALPGERVLVTLTEEHKRWAQAEVIEILDPSPDRIKPRCRHFADCGGCHYQHMPYALQLKAKSDIVRSQLERLGGFKDPPVSETVPSPSPWHTRNHLQFSVDEEGNLGFQAAGSNRVVAISECYLPNEALSEIWPRIAIDPGSPLNRVSLRSGADGKVIIAFHSDTDPEVEMSIDLPASVVWLTREDTKVLAGYDKIEFDVLHRRFSVSARSFFQVHTALAAELVQDVLTALQPLHGKVVYDLYAGVGLFSAFLAEAGATIIAVERSPWSTIDFEFNLDEFDDVHLYAATVEEALPLIPERPDAVFLDPPRAGLRREVMEEILHREPDRILYLSCDPATMARDAKRLRQGGYGLQKVTPYDLFPQTYHIETLSNWQR